MHDLHVHLNDNPVERARLLQVSAEKKCIRANQESGDPLLNLVYGVGVIVRRIRTAMNPEAGLGGQWVRSRSTEKVRESVRSVQK